MYITFKLRMQLRLIFVEKPASPAVLSILAVNSEAFGTKLGKIGLSIRG
jgi:hypothetical protein